MEGIGNILKKKPLTLNKASSERAELIGKFTDRLNVDRDGIKYKKLSYAAIGNILSHLKTKQDLYYFFRICEDSKNFSKRFWYEISLKKHGNL